MQIPFPWVEKRESLAAPSDSIPSVAVPFAFQINHPHTLRKFPDNILPANLTVSRLVQLIMARIFCLHVEQKLVTYLGAVSGSFCAALNLV